MALFFTPESLLSGGFTENWWFTWLSFSTCKCFNDGRRQPHGAGTSTRAAGEQGLCLGRGRCCGLSTTPRPSAESQLLSQVPQDLWLLLQLSRVQPVGWMSHGGRPCGRSPGAAPQLARRHFPGRASEESSGSSHSLGPIQSPRDSWPAAGMVVGVEVGGSWDRRASRWFEC